VGKAAAAVTINQSATQKRSTHLTDLQMRTYKCELWVPLGHVSVVQHHEVDRRGSQLGQIHYLLCTGDGRQVSTTAAARSTRQTLFNIPLRLSTLSTPMRRKKSADKSISSRTLSGSCDQEEAPA
jgi:hypothetical protein